MKMLCILCDQTFILTKRQEKKQKKHPHKIQLCPDCYERITQKVESRRQQKEASAKPENRVVQAEVVS